MDYGSSAATNQEFDAIIVGGGFVGGSLACALAGAGLDVAVIDHGDPTIQTSAPFDGRASAIAAAAHRLLDRLGIWQALADDATPIEDIRVADGGSPLFLHYDKDAVGVRALGYMVENRHLRKAVLRRMADFDNITHIAPAVVDTLVQRDESAGLKFSDGWDIKGRIVVGADGRASWTRQAAGIGLTHWSYEQVGIVCTVRHQHPHDNVAHEHFLPAGPFAILPLSNNRSSIVWTEKAQLAPEILGLSDAEFLEELEMRFGDFLGAIEVTGPRWSYPLALQYAETIVAPRVALAGDAAQAMHPIAGQGLNLGLRDVAALAEVLVDAARLGLDPGGAATLETYQQWRRFDSQLMLALTDGLNRLFSNDIPPVKLARDVGLAAVQHAGPLKNYFMRHAMGEAGKLPRLLQGRAL